MNSKQLRVLHVVGGLDRGGIETFLMHVLRQRDATRLKMDFVVHQDRVGAYDEQVLASGARIFRCPFTHRPPKYAREFRRILRENGPFDVVHSHVHHYDGHVLGLARSAGVPIRVSHSHTDTSHLDRRAGFARRIYLSHMRRAIQRHATLGLACSRLAAASLFGGGWENDSRWKVLPYGIDLRPFHESVERNAVREMLGVPADALLAIHVGRFDPAKNHEFLIQVAAEMAQREPSLRLLLLGHGDLQPAVEQQVRALDLEDRVLFAGSRPDVPKCLRAADVFLMPSVREGFGLACLEAQVTGLPAVVADTLPPEVSVVPGLVHFLSLNQSAMQWAQIALQVARAPRPIAPDRALEIAGQSCFNIENCVATLETIYYDAAGISSNSPTLA